DGVERLPRPGGLPGPPVHDEVLRALRNLRVQVVHEHPEGGLLGPSLAGELRSAWRADLSRTRRAHLARMARAPRRRKAGPGGRLRTAEDTPGLVVYPGSDVITSPSPTEENAERREPSDGPESDLIATVAHEIRDPMTSAIGFADMLLRKGDQM